MEQKLFFTLPFMLMLLGAAPSSYSDQSDLAEMSVEDLLNIEVVSVAKKAKSLNDSPAAIFVISQDDIQRIGATSIPEALRLAPGIDVARIDANKWAVSARGFNGRFANKLLVTIDGRNTYTRSFSGVYWENQDVMMEDVERIEIIRGPGATLWGANAVNGVINIITKHSADTLGGLLVVGGGTEEQGFGRVRYGGQLNPDTTARGYVKGFKRGENKHESGSEAGDDWEKVQGGFRMDSQWSVRDSITIQGDAYYSHINQNTTLPTISAPYTRNFNENINGFGGNLLLRQEHTFSSTSDYALQVFYDFYEREEVYMGESRQSFDMDFQHRFALMGFQDIVWGLGYRYTHDDTIFSDVGSFNTPSRNDQLFNAFIQNEITLMDDLLWLTLGSKFEHNDYSGFEVQPTARLMWAPHRQHRIWGAVSRAVRTPSRLDHDISLLQRVTPPQGFNPAIAVELQGRQGFKSEALISYEFGYRTTFIDDVSIDFTAFYNDYKRLRTLQGGPGFFNGSYFEQSIIFSNIQTAKTYGFEMAAVWQMLDWWRWDINYSLLKTDFNTPPQALQSGSISPQQSVSIHSALTPLQNIELDLLFRYVDTNTAAGLFGTQVINDYVSLDVRVAWKPVEHLELSLVGQNLLAEQHLEYRQEAFTTPTEIERGFYGKLAWSF